MLYEETAGTLVSTHQFFPAKLIFVTVSVIKEG